MITRQPPRVAPHPARIYAEARRAGKTIFAAAYAAGIGIETAMQHEQNLPPANGAEPVTTPVLGPTELTILAELIPSDGLTTSDLGVLLERSAKNFHRSIVNLAGKGCIEVARHRPARGNPAAVWVATTTGRAALKQHQQGAES